MTRKAYPTDLTDGRWALVKPLISPAKDGGRPRSADMREVVNGILYVNRTGCAWRALPHDLPPWGTTHFYYRQFRIGGVWDKVDDRLREDVRVAASREPTPSAAVIDSRSVKTTGKGGYTGTTRARRSTAASGTSSSTRCGWSSQLWCMRGTSRTGTGPSGWSRNCPARSPGCG